MVLTRTSACATAGMILLLALATAGCGSSRLCVDITAEQARQAGLAAAGGMAAGPDGEVYLVTEDNVVRYDPRRRTFEPLLSAPAADICDVAAADDGVVLVLREREVSACLAGYLVQVAALPGKGTAIAASPEGFYVAVRTDDGAYRVLRYLYSSKCLEQLLATDDRLGALAAAPGGCLVASGGNIHTVSDPAPAASASGPSEVSMRLVCGVSAEVKSVAGDARSGYLYFSDGAMTYALAEGKILPILPTGGRLAVHDNVLTVCHAGPTQLLRIEGASRHVRKLLRVQAVAPGDRAPADLNNPEKSLDAAEKIDESRSGTYHYGRWEYRFAITGAGTKSAGTRGELLFDGKPVEEPGAAGDFYRTPWGEIQWVGNPIVQWGAHGWMPRPPEAKAGRALSEPWLEAGAPVVLAMVLREADATGKSDPVEPWVQEEMKNLGVKGFRVEQSWFPLSDQALTAHDTKMTGTLLVRLSPPRDAATLTVILDGTEPARVDLPRKDGTTKLVRHILQPWLRPLPGTDKTFYLAFRVERAAPDYPKPLDAGMEADGKTVIVKGAREVIIGLPGDKSSGCVWVVKSVTGGLPKRSSVEAVGQVQFTPAATPQTGTAREGIFENTLRVVNKGQSVVELGYERTWQTDQPAEKTFRVTLDVQDLPAGSHLPAHAQPTAAEEDKPEKLHFSYEYQSGLYVRKMSGTIEDPQGLWNALLPLQPPPGARGEYGLLGDDALLGKEPGFGLKQLGGVARKYLTFESLIVEQPEGSWTALGVQSGKFTRAEDLNDMTLGWAFFDLRGKFEADVKKWLGEHPKAAAEGKP